MQISQTNILLLLVGTLLLASYKIGQPSQFDTEQQTQNYQSEQQVYHSLFKKWKADFSKIYQNQQEDQYRFLVFIENINFINNYNKNEGIDYLSPNHLTDLTNQEYQSLFLNNKKLEKNSNSTLKQAKSSNKLKNVDPNDLPSQVDWVQKGAVSTTIYDVGKCEGGSYAFGAAGALEGAYFLETGKYVELSAQQLISCDKNNWGCDGGDEIQSYVYILNNGIMTAESYPYKSGTWGDDYSCEYDSSEVVFKITDAYKIQYGNPLAMQTFVSQQPIVAGVDGSSDVFRFFNGKHVFKMYGCGEEVNTSVLISGYNDEEEDEGPYWIIKGFLGKYWSDQGFMKIQKTMTEGDGMCGINIDTNFPVYKPNNQ